MLDVLDGLDVEVLISLVAVIILIIAAGVFAFRYRGIRKQIEDALTEASEEEQAEIRKKVVKALFPPRFNR